MILYSRRIIILQTNFGLWELLCYPSGRMCVLQKGNFFAITLCT
jgi:hypothetical protein